MCGSSLPNNTMKTKLKSVPVALLVAASFLTSTSAHEPVAEQPETKVQLAILLDTSNSMDGLIQQAKTQLWSIVNTFGHAKRDGQQAFVEVALYEYGNSALDRESYFIRQVLPFTRDLDEVSEQLFQLKTNGGDEFCGAVIRRATEQLAWDNTPGTYRAMFIAGNEPFNQGSIDPGSACREAMDSSILVNTIHCGAEEVGVNSGWKSGALVTGGNFSVIDQNKRVVEITCPQDAVIIQLNGDLNKTYLKFGSKGDYGCANQMRQDSNAEVSQVGQVNRAVTKSTLNYSNRSWDLVDACKDENFEITKVKRETLPLELQELEAKELAAKVAEMTAKREEIQGKIQQLNREREAFLIAERKRLGEEAKGTLGDEVRKAVSEQAKKLGYELSPR